MPQKSPLFTQSPAQRDQRCAASSTCLDTAVSPAPSVFRSVHWPRCMHRPVSTPARCRGVDPWSVRSRCDFRKKFRRTVGCRCVSILFVSIFRCLFHLRNPILRRIVHLRGSTLPLPLSLANVRSYTQTIRESPTSAYFEPATEH